MNKKSAFSTLLFIISWVFAVAAIATKRWVWTEFNGFTSFGLNSMCVKFKDYRPGVVHEEVCQPLNNFVSFWAVTLANAGIGMFFILATIIMMLFSIWRENFENVARQFAFFPLLLFCVAAVAFPFGFTLEHISGKYYQLPENYHLGYSYYLFFAAVFLLSIAVGLINSELIRFNFRT